MFNLDLHISVIADVRTVLESRGVSVTDWSISGHTWVFGRQREPVAVVNERTYKRFGPEMVGRFQRIYGRHLRSYRGFVATHTPCFALLYRGLDRPTVALCTTRYEWPFTFDRESWAWLDEGLARGVEDGWLSLVANNRADAGYVENYLGIRPAIFPADAPTSRRPTPGASRPSSFRRRATASQERSAGDFDPKRSRSVRDSALATAGRSSTSTARSCSFPTTSA